jgi:chaperonin GroES
MLARTSSSLWRSFAKSIGIKPLGARVALELEKAADKIGSLYVPESAKQQTNRGTVVAVGPGALVDGNFVPVTLKVGQKVLLPAYGGQVVRLNKEEFTIVNEESVLAVFE